MRVHRGDRSHDQERRHDERQRNQKRAERTALQVAEPHRQLRGERPRHRLRDSQSLLVLVLAVPATRFDKIAPHVASQSDWSPEPHGAEPQEVEDESAQRSRNPPHHHGRFSVRALAHNDARREDPQPTSTSSTTMQRAVSRTQQAGGRRR